MNASQKTEKAKTIETGMTNNAHFRSVPKAQDLITELASSRNALEKAIELAEYGDKRALAARNLCEKDLDEKIRKLAGFVNVEAGGDETLIQAAGFELRRRNNQPKPMTPPLSPNLKRTETSGEIALQWKPVPNSKNYFIEISPADKPVKNWKTTTYSTKSRCVIDGLNPGAKYIVRVRAIGAHGVGPPSESLEFIAT